MFSFSRCSSLERVAPIRVLLTFPPQNGRVYLPGQCSQQALAQSEAQPSGTLMLSYRLLNGILGLVYSILYSYAFVRAPASRGFPSSAENRNEILTI